MPNGWTSPPGAFAADSEEAAVKLEREMVLILVSELMTHTPFDTGRAKGNWIPSLDHPSEEVFPNRFDKSGAAGRARALGLTKRLKKLRDVWIVNNLDYIEHLENGTNKFRPFAMMRKSVAATLSRLR